MNLNLKMILKHNTFEWTVMTDKIYQFEFQPDKLIPSKCILLMTISTWVKICLFSSYLKSTLYYSCIHNNIWTWIIQFHYFMRPRQTIKQYDPGNNNIHAVIYFNNNNTKPLEIRRFNVRLWWAESISWVCGSGWNIWTITLYYYNDGRTIPGLG
jgi:hypothetical protein